MTLTDAFTRLCGTGQDLTNVTTAGVLSTNWVDIGATTVLGSTALSKRAFGGGQLVVARFGCSVSLNSATENATVDLQIVALPKTTIGTQTFTVDASSDFFAAASHGLIDGTRITVASSGTLPAGLAASTNYYLRDASAAGFKASLTPGGAVVNITDTGTGTHTLTWYPEVLVSVQAVGIDRIMADLTSIEVALPPPQNTRLYPVGRYIFARFLPTATLTAGTVTCDLVGGYAQDGKPFNAVNYVTA